MPNNRVKWVMVLLALIVVTFACSKKEEETTPQGVKQETPAEQKKEMTGETKEQPAAETSRQEEEQKTATAQQGGEKPAASGGQGEAIYQQTCSSCHATGVAGAPKMGDSQAWSSRIAKGEEQLVQNALNGIGTMPPKGGDPSLTEEDIRAAVNYMIEQSR